MNKLWDKIYVMFIEFYMKKDHVVLRTGNYDSFYTRHSSADRSSNRPSYKPLWFY